MTTPPENFSDQYNTPIHKLDVDVLEYIFLLNSDMNGEDRGEMDDPLMECAYNVTLYSSQTCRL